MLHAVIVMAQSSDMWGQLPTLFATARDFMAFCLHWQTAAVATRCPVLPVIPACPELVCAVGPARPVAHCGCTRRGPEAGYRLRLAGAGLAVGSGLRGLALGAAGGFAAGR